MNEIQSVLEMARTLRKDYEAAHKSEGWCPLCMGAFGVSGQSCLHVRWFHELEDAITLAVEVSACPNCSRHPELCAVHNPDIYTEG